MSGPVAAPDWYAAPRCGGGLHALLWGEGDGSLLNWAPDALWLVLEISSETPIVDLCGKVKFPACAVVHVGDQQSAVDLIMELGAPGPVVGSMLTGGDRSTLTGGYRSTLTGGNDSTLTGGYRSTLTGGYRSTLTGGIDSVFVFHMQNCILTAVVGAAGILPGVAYHVRAGQVVPV